MAIMASMAVRKCVYIERNFNVIRSFSSLILSDQSCKAYLSFISAGNNLKPSGYIGKLHIYNILETDFSFPVELPYNMDSIVSPCHYCLI